MSSDKIASQTYNITNTLLFCLKDSVSSFNVSCYHCISLFFLPSSKWLMFFLVFHRVGALRIFPPFIPLSVISTLPYAYHPSYNSFMSHTLVIVRCFETYQSFWRLNLFRDRGSETKLGVMLCSVSFTHQIQSYWKFIVLYRCFDFKKWLNVEKRV